MYSGCNRSFFYSKKEQEENNEMHTHRSVDGANKVTTAAVVLLPSLLHPQQTSGRLIWKKDSSSTMIRFGGWRLVVDLSLITEAKGDIQQQQQLVEWEGIEARHWGGWLPPQWCQIPGLCRCVNVSGF